MMPAFSHNSVLIVDDELAIRGMLQRIFEAAGFMVGTAENGIEGLRRFEQSRWDVIIVDRGMPEMSGEEMAKQIKSTHPNIPIFLITGLPHAVTMRELYYSVLAKPFQPTRLLDLVAEAMAARVSESEVNS